MLDLQCCICCSAWGLGKLKKCWIKFISSAARFYQCKSMSFCFITICSKMIPSCLEKVTCFSCFQCISLVLKYNFTYSLGCKNTNTNYLLQVGMWRCRSIKKAVQDHPVDQDANPMFPCIAQEASPFFGTLKILLNWPRKIFMFRLMLSNRCDWMWFSTGSLLS